MTAPATDFLATDEKLESILMRPGDEVFCLGFPPGAAPGGFPLLRSGYIASYPIAPMRAVKQIEVDIPLMYGNSGSPVYYCYRDRRWSRRRSRGLLGIVCRGATTLRRSSKTRSWVSESSHRPRSLKRRSRCCRRATPPLLSSGCRP